MYIYTHYCIIHYIHTHIMLVSLAARASRQALIGCGLVACGLHQVNKTII